VKDNLNPVYKQNKIWENFWILKITVLKCQAARPAIRFDGLGDAVN